MARKKPTPKIQKKDINRGRELKRDDSVKNVSVEIMDMDSAIMYYFNEVIQPIVEEAGEQVKVPVLYANPERWVSIRKPEYLREKKGQLITPRMVFKGRGMEKIQVFQLINWMLMILNYIIHLERNGAKRIDMIS